MGGTLEYIGRHVGVWVFFRDPGRVTDVSPVFLTRGQAVRVRGGMDLNILELVETECPDDAARKVLDATRHEMVRVRSGAGGCRTEKLVWKGCVPEDVKGEYKAHALELMRYQIRPGKYTARHAQFVSQSGFNRHHQKSVLFPELTLPGAFGLMELRADDGLAVSTWRNLVNMAVDLAVCDGMEGRLHLSGMPAVDAVRLLSRRLGGEWTAGDDAVYQSLLAIAVLATSACGWKNLWSSDPPRRDTIAVNKTLFGTHDDCEDQASTTIATITSVKKNHERFTVDGSSARTRIPAIVAAFIAEAFVDAKLVFGYAEASVSTAKHKFSRTRAAAVFPGDVATKMAYPRGSPPQGHAWVVYTFRMYDGATKRFIVETTMPYLPHVDVGVYRGIISEPTGKVPGDNVYPSPPPIDPQR